MKFALPDLIDDLVEARNLVRDHYRSLLASSGQDTLLRFTFDGNLMGDLGECIAADLFNVQLAAGEGIDGYWRDAASGASKSVQVKVTGVNGGPLFRNTTTRADHLLFFAIDMTNRTGEVVYNGPEAPVIETIPRPWTGQRQVSMSRMRALAKLVHDEEKLPLVRRVS